MPGSGKNEFVEMGKKFSHSIIVMGDVVRDETLKRGFPLEMHGAVAQKLREELGESAVAQLVIPRIYDEKRTIIDGVRGWSEVEEFRLHFDVTIVGIVCPTLTRYERLKVRGREGDPKTFEEFEERDFRELGFGLGDVLALADYYIENERTLEEFRKACKDFLGNTGEKRQANEFTWKTFLTGI
jgi:dephospho-CoA kinase